MNYEELAKSLRICVNNTDCVGCIKNADGTEFGCKPLGDIELVREAADAIEELLHAAKKMHTWIFLHSYDEQEAYDECGLSDEMNAALGYGGQFELRAEPLETVYYPQVDGVTPTVVAPKEET